MDKSIRGIVILIGIMATVGLINFVVNDKVKDSYIKRAYAANAMAVASMIKVKVETYYSENGELPNSNFALGLPEADGFRRDGLKGIVIEDSGVIHLIIDDKDSGKDGHIFMIPQDLNNHFNDRWLCLTPSYKTISEWAPQCKYKPVEGW